MKRLLTLLAAGILAAAAPAQADLAAVGPLNVATGFPAWFEDAVGQRLQLCDEFDPTLPAEEQLPCLPELTNPALGVVAGNIVEALYYAAAAQFPGPNGEAILAQCVLEAAGPELGVGDNSVGNVALLRIDNLTVPGDYTVVTPCTNVPFTFNVPNDVAVGGRFTGEQGASGVPPDFAGALPGAVQNFASNGTNAAGFLGDGITPGPLSSPLRPGGPTTVAVSGAITATSDQFSVVGKVSGCDDTNVPPVANADLGFTGAGAAVAVAVAANDTDLGGTLPNSSLGGVNPASIRIVRPPASGTAVPNFNGTITYTPPANFSGRPTFTYEIQDFCGLTSNPATVGVLVDDLQVGKAEYRARTGTWDVAGTSGLGELSISLADGFTTYATPLTGAQEVPPNSSQSTGFAAVTSANESPTAIDFHLEADPAPTSLVTQAHIHVGGTGANGPFIFWLCGNDSVSPPLGTPACQDVAGTPISVGGVIQSTDPQFVPRPANGISTFAEAVSAIAAGTTYVNVHTVEFGPGEIRGQLGRNVVGLRAGDRTGAVIHVREVPSGTGSRPWGFQGKSPASPGAEPLQVHAETFPGSDITDTEPLRLR